MNAGMLERIRKALRACSTLCAAILIDADAKPELRKEAAEVMRKLEALLFTTEEE
jgi:hypothetical protein